MRSPLRIRYVLMTAGVVDHDRVVEGRPVPRLKDEIDTGAAVYTVSRVRWHMGLSRSDPDLAGTPAVFVFGSRVGTWERGNLIPNIGKCMNEEEP